MTGALRAYPVMKRTDMPWLGELPASWGIVRSKYLFREVDRRSATGEETHLSMSQQQGLLPASQVERRALISENYIGGKLVDRGDLVLNRLKAHLGVFAHAGQPGIVSPDYTVLRPERNVNVRYYELVLRSAACRGELRTRAKGIVEGFWRLYTDDFYDIRLPVPTPDEQRKIVTFLDWRGSHVVRLLREKHNVLKLVAEERESLTHDIIRSADSRSVRLGVAVDKVFRPVVRDNHETYTPIGLFNRGRGIFHKEPTLGSELGDSTFNWIEKDDLILSGQFAWEGSIAIVGSEDVGCIASHRYHALRPKAGVMEVTYLSSFFKTSFGHLLLNEHSRGAAGRNRPLNINTLLKEHIPLPTPESQRRLVELVTLERQLTASIKSLSARLHEFRMRLIEDVVLGQVAIPDDTPALLDNGISEPATIDYFDVSDEDFDAEEES